MTSLPMSLLVVCAVLLFPLVLAGTLVLDWTGAEVAP
jgi:hypothetical protein